MCLESYGGVFLVFDLWGFFLLLIVLLRCLL